MDHNEKKKEERALWKNRITDLNISGLTVTQYAKTNDLSVHQIYYWKARLGDRSKNPPTPKVEAVSPVIKITSKPSSNQSKLPDPKWIAELIKALHEVF